MKMNDIEFLGKSLRKEQKEALLRVLVAETGKDVKPMLYAIIFCGNPVPVPPEALEWAKRGLNEREKSS